MCDLPFNVCFVLFLVFFFSLFFFNFVCCLCLLLFRCKLRAINLTFLARLLDLLCVFDICDIVFCLRSFLVGLTLALSLSLSFSLYINLCLAKIYCSHGVLCVFFSLVVCVFQCFGAEDVRLRVLMSLGCGFMFQKWRPQATISRYGSCVTVTVCRNGLRGVTGLRFLAAPLGWCLLNLLTNCSSHIRLLSKHYTVRVSLFHWWYDDALLLTLNVCLFAWGFFFLFFYYKCMAGSV